MLLFNQTPAKPTDEYSNNVVEVRPSNSLAISKPITIEGLSWLLFYLPLAKRELPLQFSKAALVTSGIFSQQCEIHLEKFAAIAKI
jgi:hypothetical protein